MHSVHHVTHGGSLELSATSPALANPPALAIVSGVGRGSTLRLDGAFSGIWIPLRGRLQLGADLAIYPGEARITEPEQRLEVIARGNALWVAIVGTTNAWRSTFTGLLDVLALEPPLLPARHAADRDLRRCAIALVRASASAAPGISAEALLDRILTLQEGFSGAIARCRGRSYAQRRQIFLRLQRVRNHLATNCHMDIDNDFLARMASYSPCHFIRAFRAVYGETPHAYLVQQRLERARLLLRASPLAIAEVAFASGFENRCAFSRLFRQRFGTTASAMRRHGTTNKPLVATTP